MSAIYADFQALGYALLQGLLIGLERGWSARGGPPGSRVAGIRTFGLLGLIGGIAGLVGSFQSTVLVGLAGTILLVGYVRQSRQPTGLSATNMLAGMLVLALVVMVTLGRPIEAMATAAIATLLLSMRQPLHNVLEGISPAEMRAAARFAIIALVILPMAPDQAMGPLGAWNPHKLWLVVVLVSGLSFLGYVLSRRASSGRSLLITAICGALVSSTAVTVAYARKVKTEPGQGALFGSAILIAGAVMFARVLLLSALLVPRTVPTLVIALGPALLFVAGIGAFGARRNGDRPAATPAAANPLELRTALSFALWAAAMALLAQWGLRHFGNLGFAGALAITGFADVDAAILALASSSPDLIEPVLAARILLIPVILNTLLKAGLTLAIARSRDGLRAATILAASGVMPGIAAMLV